MSQQQPHLVRNTSNTPLGLSAGVPFTPGFQSRSDEDDGPPYVFDILPFSAGYMAAATDSRLKYLDRTSLKTIRTFETARSASENDRLTHISGRRSSSSTDLEGQEMLLASYANGCVNLFDMRSASSPTSFDPQIRLKGEGPYQASTTSSCSYRLNRRMAFDRTERCSLPLRSGWLERNLRSQWNGALSARSYHPDTVSRSIFREELPEESSSTE